MNIRLKIMAVAVAMACSCVAQAASDEREKVEVLHETTLNLIGLLVEQGVLKQEVADAMMRKAEEKAAKKVATQRTLEKKAEAEAAAKEKNVVRVGYVPEHVKREMRDQIRQEVVAQARQERWGDVNAVPEWLDRLKWEGDVRLRYQSDQFSDMNAPVPYFEVAGQNIGNTTDDRKRERIRLRLGLNANVTSGVDVGVRITTGTTSDPVSTNQTLGTTSNKYSLVLDRAFLKLTPVDWFSASGGRIPNPFFGTDLVWDEDLNFEGAAATFRPWASETLALKPFLTVGAFSNQEIEKSASVRADSKWMLGAQAGLVWNLDARTRFKLGVAYYDYKHIEGIPNPTLSSTQFNKTAPDFRQKGNSLFNIDNDGNPATNLWALATDYDVANLTLVADFAQFDPVHLIGTIDYAQNQGFDRNEILARTGQSIEPEVTGYLARLAVGYPVIADRHDWQAYVAYRYLERDAVPDAFTDSDFHLGGTNNKGFIIGGMYGLAKNTWLSARWMSSDQISGLPLSIDVLQVDLNAKF